MLERGRKIKKKEKEGEKRMQRWQNGEKENFYLARESGREREITLFSFFYLFILLFKKHFLTIFISIYS